MFRGSALEHLGFSGEPRRAFILTPRPVLGICFHLHDLVDLESLRGQVLPLLDSDTEPR
jgi:hypothetical protein